MKEICGGGVASLSACLIYRVFLRAASAGLQLPQAPVAEFDPPLCARAPHGKRCLGLGPLIFFFV